VIRDTVREVASGRPRDDGSARATG
jgi:hypothetical protein